MGVNLYISLRTSKVAWVGSIDVGFFDPVIRERQTLELLLEEGIQDLLIRWIEDKTRWPRQDCHVCWLASAE